MVTHHGAAFGHDSPTATRAVCPSTLRTRRRPVPRARAVALFALLVMMQLDRRRGQMNSGMREGEEVAFALRRSAAPSVEIAIPLARQCGVGVGLP